MKRTLYLFLLKETVPAFVLGLFGFTRVLLTGRILQLTELFVNKGVPLGYILRLLYFLVPQFLVPLSLQTRAARGSKSRGGSWSIGILLVYYLLINAGTSLAERGIILLEVGMWAPNLIFLALGIHLLVKTANEKPVLNFVWAQKGIEWLRLKPRGGGGIPG